MKTTRRLMEELRQKHCSVFVEISWSSASLGGHWIVGVSPTRGPARNLAKGETLRKAVKLALEQPVFEADDQERLLSPCCKAPMTWENETSTSTCNVCRTDYLIPFTRTFDGLPHPEPRFTKPRRASFRG